MERTRCIARGGLGLFFALGIVWATTSCGGKAQQDEPDNQDAVEVGRAEDAPDSAADEVAPEEIVGDAMADGNAAVDEADEDTAEDLKGQDDGTAPEVQVQPATDFADPASWSAFDASGIDGNESWGYFGAVFDGKHVYYAPCRWGQGAFHGVVLRHNTQADYKETASWESYDAGSTDGAEAKGYANAVFDGRYVYFVPFCDNENTWHGVVLRYDTQAGFNQASSWSAYDAGSTGGQVTEGYNGAAFDGRYVYFVPFGYEGGAHGRVLRYDTKADFKAGSSWSVHLAGTTDGLQTRGFYGSAYDGRHVYFVPFHDGSEFHGRALRYDTTGDFDSPSNWQAYDAGQSGGMTTVGYKGATFDGRYVYYAPFRDAAERHGRVLRYDSEGAFDSPDSWAAYDASGTGGLSSIGYVGAEFDQKRYVYFVPYMNADTAYHGVALRYDTLSPFDSAVSWSAFDASQVDGMSNKGYKYSAFDGQNIYFVPFSKMGNALKYDTGAD